MQETVTNALKVTLGEGRPVIGSYITIGSPAIAEIMALAGFDFLTVDLPNTSLSLETAEGIVRAVEVMGKVPVLRVPDRQAVTIGRALDTGALGVEVPGVATAEEARQVVQAAKYYPEGSRRAATPRAARYSAIPVSTYFGQANKETMVIVHCDTTKALANLPEILAVEGIDVVYVGPYEIAQALGAPGQVNLPAVQEALRGALATIIASGVAAGTTALSAAHARLLIQRQVRYLTLGRDYLYLLHGCRNDLTEARRPEKQ
ncbi:MAG: aldolase/citrate lyase family protein [Dehalococcoidales bacterium]|nr:aldolase/citrate lyase family protein [Dehalococcoidales bacterium]